MNENTAAPGTEPVQPKIDEYDDLCLQCQSNARWNRAGGYYTLAAECRAYCLGGHDVAAAGRTS